MLMLQARHRRLLYGRAHRLPCRRGDKIIQGRRRFLRRRHLSTMGRPARAGELVAKVSCPVQGHFGELDKNPPPDEMRKLDAELTRFGKPHEFFFYADAPHGFNRTGWHGYRPEADATSWARTLEFFQQHLGEVPAKQDRRGGLNEHASR